MANSKYTEATESILRGGEIAWGDLVSTTFKAQFVDIAPGHYTVDLDVDQFLDAISSGDRVGAAVTIPARTVVDGVAGSGGFSTTPITANSSQDLALVIYQDLPATTDATRRLVAYFDTGVNLPFTPNGGVISVNVDPTNGWFKL